MSEEWATENTRFCWCSVVLSDVITASDSRVAESCCAILVSFQWKKYSTISQSSVVGHMSVLICHTSFQPHYVSGSFKLRTPHPSPRFDDARDAKTYMDYPGIREAAAIETFPYMLWNGFPFVNPFPMFYICLPSLNHIFYHVFINAFYTLAVYYCTVMVWYCYGYEPSINMECLRWTGHVACFNSEWKRNRFFWCNFVYTCPFWQCCFCKYIHKFMRKNTWQGMIFMWVENLGASIFNFRFCRPWMAFVSSMSKASRFEKIPMGFTWDCLKICRSNIVKQWNTIHTHTIYESTWLF